jgi:hypothetical protein
MSYIPDDGVKTSPLPHQEERDQARNQYMCAALDRLRYEARPVVLEPRSHHDRMLQPEKGNQQEIDGDGGQDVITSEARRLS